MQEFAVFYKIIAAVRWWLRFNGLAGARPARRRCSRTQ